MTENTIDDVLALLENIGRLGGEGEFGNMNEVKFKCGCKLMTMIGQPRYSGFREVCKKHKEEYEYKLGKDVLEQMMIKEYDASGNLSDFKG